MDTQKKPLRFSDFFSVMNVPEKEEEEIPLHKVLSNNIDNYACTGKHIKNENVLLCDDGTQLGFLGQNPSYAEFESCLWNENFNLEFDESDNNEPSFLLNADSIENVSQSKNSDLTVESNRESITAANDAINKDIDPILDIEEDVDFVKHSVNVNLTFIVDISMSTNAVKELLSDVVTISLYPPTL